MRNVYRITFEEWLDSLTEPHSGDLHSCGDDSAIVVVNGDCLAAAVQFSKSRVGKELPPYTDDETGKECRDVVAECSIHGIERLHTGVEVLT